MRIGQNLGNPRKCAFKAKKIIDVVIIRNKNYVYLLAKRIST